MFSIADVLHWINYVKETTNGNLSYAYHPNSDYSFSLYIIFFLNYFWQLWFFSEIFTLFRQILHFFCLISVKKKTNSCFLQFVRFSAHECQITSSRCEKNNIIRQKMPLCSCFYFLSFHHAKHSCACRE